MKKWAEKWLNAANDDLKVIYKNLSRVFWKN